MCSIRSSGGREWSEPVSGLLNPFINAGLQPGSIRKRQIKNCFNSFFAWITAKWLEYSRKENSQLEPGVGEKTRTRLRKSRTLVELGQQFIVGLVLLERGGKRFHRLDGI